MRELRAKWLEEPKEAYGAGRIADQLHCSRKARWNKERSQRWNVSLMFLEILRLWSGQSRDRTSLFAKEVFGETGAAMGNLVAWTPGQ